MTNDTPAPDAATPPRLTSLAHGGGCGCKLAPSVLQQLVSAMPPGPIPPNLLVGLETGDDAAVWRLNDTQALVATTDFFTPIVDDPRDFGRIAAANALSDVYAMGGTPILALALLGLPLGRLDPAVAGLILAGGAEVCAGAGIPVAGGHSIDSPEPIYGLVALGLVHPDRILRNRGARPGDALVLTKPLGIGVYGAALKRDLLPPELYRAMLASATKLNSVGSTLAATDGVHAVTDVTGFALLGHALEMCRASELSATIDATALRFLPGVEQLARDGIVTGAASRNWTSYGNDVRLSPDHPDWHRALLCDPQTSGGLLLAVSPNAADAVLALLREAGHADAAIIGRFEAGPPTITVR
ncbi:MAG: selenide, water dikinase SelD [Gluconacetobacter diazotrophicus]|nr:selenide, water dikinase SelD [Gluconacetobacter diazotrophicus]